MKYAKIAIILIALMAVTGCKKSYLETSPSRDVTSESLFKTTTTAYQLIDGIARVMNTSQAAYTTQDEAAARANDFGESAVRLESDCLGQDMVRGGAAVASYDWFYYCSNYIGIRQPLYNVAQLPFRLYYNIINAANLLLDSVGNVAGDQQVKNNLKGQAYAFRAYSYYKASVFYCKTYIGANGQPQLSEPGLPLYLTGTQSSTKGKPRSTLGELYQQIVSDLDSAKYYLEASTPPGGRPMSDITKPVLYGITAEVALVMHDWQKAYDFANMAMNNTTATLMSRSQYKEGFNSKSNPEWMWASNLTANQRAGMYGQNFFSFVDPTNRAGYAAIGITTSMAKKTLDVMKGMDDVRAETFTATRQQTKFRVADPNSWEFDLLYMRLAEMYLIKAEAAARMNNEAEAIEVLSALVRARNPQYDYNSVYSRYTTANSVGFTDAEYATYYGTAQSTPLLREIYLQRRIELFLEGFAYNDIQRLHCGLKRPTGIGNFSPGKTIKPDDNEFLFKIPQQELDANPAMSNQQNP